MRTSLSIPDGDPVAEALRSSPNASDLVRAAVAAHLEGARPLNLSSATRQHLQALPVQIDPVALAGALLNTLVESGRLADFLSGLPVFVPKVPPCLQPSAQRTDLDTDPNPVQGSASVS